VDAAQVHTQTSGSYGLFPMASVQTPIHDARGIAVDRRCRPEIGIR
jgi:hypothetical protein